MTTIHHLKHEYSQTQRQQLGWHVENSYCQDVLELQVQTEVAITSNWEKESEEENHKEVLTWTELGRTE